MGEPSSRRASAMPSLTVPLSSVSTVPSQAYRKLQVVATGASGLTFWSASISSRTVYMSVSYPSCIRTPGSARYGIPCMVPVSASRPLLPVFPDRPELVHGYGLSCPPRHVVLEGRDQVGNLVIGQQAAARIRADTQPVTTVDPYGTNRQSLDVMAVVIDVRHPTSSLSLPKQAWQRPGLRPALTKLA